MMNERSVRTKLTSLADARQAKLLQGFFKTGKGEYGEGDIFLGIKVPELRRVAKHYKDLSFAEAKTLLQSKVHDHRLVALLILIDQYRRADEQKKKAIHEFYLAHTSHVNNWDLVDLTAPTIVGEFLVGKNKDLLYRLAASRNLWEKRIAMIATAAFIKRGETKDSFKLATIFLKEQHDLMHKAAGWMLREVGKKSGQEVLEEFLRKHYRSMPRTMLRYAIERFPEERRQAYLKGMA